MKIFVGLLVMVFASSCVNKSIPDSIDISKEWQFSPDENNIGITESWFDFTFDASSWETIDAGKRWEDQGYPNLDSIAWYRKFITIPTDWKEGQVWLKFGGINDSYQLFINGKKITGFGIDTNHSVASELAVINVSEQLKHGERNLITLRISDFGDSGGLWRLPAIITTIEKQESDFQRMKYNNEELVVDLGVGLWAWPLPTDYDGDGDYDLLVSCSDKPYNGTYFFENTEGDVKMPVFKQGVKISRGHKNIQASFVNNQTKYLIPGKEITSLKKEQFVEIYPKTNIHIEGRKIRANQWKYCDYDGDTILDLMVSVGDWKDYGWDNAFDTNGHWKQGALHGYIYFIKNTNTNESPQYENPKLIFAGDSPIDVYGMPSANFADFDNDGDLDIICGEFIDKFTYFENIGTRTNPKYTSGKFLTFDDAFIKMDLNMITPVAIDWDKDGDDDLVVGQEDGRVAFIENTGVGINNIPQFKLPVFFSQEANNVKFGALVTPFSTDWDNDGDEDLICGNSAGYIGFIENLDGANPPSWAAPVYLKVDSENIRIQADYNGSIQGPCESKWGYTILNVEDWDNDGLKDIIINSIWGKIEWYKNIGDKSNPKLSKAQPIEVEWQANNPKPIWNWWEPKGNNLVTQWRTTPLVYDWNKDGLMDLIMLDHEGYLAFFERAKQNKKMILLPGNRIFYDENMNPLRLNKKGAGGSGRKKLAIVDWDLDGKLDLLVNSENVNFLRNIGSENGKVQFKDMGMLSEQILAGHSTSPAIVDWDKNGIPDLLLGAEDGCFYYRKNGGFKTNE